MKNLFSAKIFMPFCLILLILCTGCKEKTEVYEFSDLTMWESSQDCMAGCQDIGMEYKKHKVSGETSAFGLDSYSSCYCKCKKTGWLG